MIKDRTGQTTQEPPERVSTMISTCVSTRVPTWVCAGVYMSLSVVAPSPSSPPSSSLSSPLYVAVSSQPHPSSSSSYCRRTLSRHRRRRRRPFDAVLAPTLHTKTLCFATSRCATVPTKCDREDRPYAPHRHVELGKLKKQEKRGAKHWIIEAMFRQDM